MDASDASRLEQLESDIAAVASAMETVDRIAAESGGEAAADEIAAVVSPERFPVEAAATGGIERTGPVVGGQQAGGPVVEREESSGLSVGGQDAGGPVVGREELARPIADGVGTARPPGPDPVER